MVDNCDVFHFVETGSTCSDVLSANGITLTQLYQWNPSVRSNCAGLWVEVYVCVSTVGHTPTPANPGNGIETPTPLQREIVSNCDVFHMVEADETCDIVASNNGVSVADLKRWNPSVGSNCAGLWANAYACVSIIGHTPTPVNPGNGIETPTPLQREIVSNCDAFHMVDADETCDTVASNNGISVADLKRWNPSVGSNCDGLWANAYACVSIIGHTPTPVNPGNGVQTPSPIQGGMTKSCKTFHFINGNTCQNILDRYRISLANFVRWNPAVGNNCQSMWDQTYVCVAVL
jgi:LysM repeat protein